MRILKIFKYCTISFSVASALAMSANAACTATYCYGGEIGLGGMYHNLKGDSLNDTGYGGYLSVFSRNIFMQRFQAVGGVQVGLGAGQSDGAESFLIRYGPKSALTRNGMYMMYDINLKLGSNIFTPNFPLFINFFVDWNQVTSYQRGRTLLAIGAELEGEIPLGNLHLTYSGGYGWIALSDYNIGGAYAGIGGYNYLIKASLGLAYNVTDNTAMYIKAIGKYYSINSAASIPALNHFTAMLEIGFKTIRGYERTY